jgi:hypothetical protein
LSEERDWAKIGEIFGKFGYFCLFGIERLGLGFMFFILPVKLSLFRILEPIVLGNSKFAFTVPKANKCLHSIYFVLNISDLSLSTNIIIYKYSF